jgi:transposase
MKSYTYFFGVDVSKRILGISLLHQQVLTHRQFQNDKGGMVQLLQWLQACDVNFEVALFCMEATGLYCFILTSFLAGNSIDTWVEQATQIKKQVHCSGANQTR